MNQVEFEPVKPSEEQVRRLFELLGARLHKISCEETKYSDHERFVNSHPYRFWFLVKVRAAYVGSFYVSKDNTIGINVLDEHVSEVVSLIINFVKNHFKPLPAIPSVRSGQFSINVPPSNRCLVNALKAIDAEIAQITFFLPY